MGPFGQVDYDEGFPVSATGFDENGNVTDSFEFKGSRRQAIDPDAFSPPGGYKKRTMGPQ